MLVTSQPLATADLHILDPKKPFPPQTTSRFVDAVAIANCVVEAVKWKEKHVMSVGVLSTGSTGHPAGLACGR
jgi:hypothetical protein